jgi:hypothetical protein
MNIVIFSRLYLFILLCNIGGWIYFGYLLYYTNNITTQTCNSYTKELTEAIKILFGISMSITTLNILTATNDIITYEENIIVENLIYLGVTSLLFLSITGINGLVIFSLTSGMTDIRCTDSDSEFGLKLSVYGTIWITFIEIVIILLSLLSFISGIIINTKLHLVCEPFIKMIKNYRERRIAIEPSLPKYNKNDVSIPITALKENKFLCSICYDSAITLLLEPCNHICICQLCYNSLIKNECPICKTKILATRKIYFANLDF